MEKKLKIFLLLYLFCLYVLFFLSVFVLYCMVRLCFSLLGLLLVGCALSSCSVRNSFSTELPLQVAHRGGASLGPENTLLCVERAIIAGVAVVEVDVRLTADSVAVIMHDASVDRTTNGRGRLAAMSLSSVKELSIVDSDGAVTAERVPTLCELLEFVGGRCCLLLDIKDSAASGVVEAVLAAVDKCGAESWVTVQSFSDSVLRRFRSLGAPFPLEKLVVFKLPLLPIIFDGSLRFFSLQKYSYISSFNINRHFLSSAFIDYLHRNGKAVKAWTFDCDSKLKSVVFSLDAIITDCPK